MALTSTIFALATGAPPSAVAIIRLSGPATAAILAQIAPGAVLQARRSTVRRLRDGEGRIIDEALLLWFEPGASYTGEASAELHVHGGRAVIDAVSQRLLQLGARPAGAGEFTRRAVASGRLDLAQAEAVAELIEAQGEAARAHAARLMDGAVGRLVEDWRAAVLEILGLIETGVDFVDEDLGADLEARALEQLIRLRQSLEREAQQASITVADADLLTLALIGPPNAGKSSFLNAVARTDAAIVTSRPGTTRDAISVTLDMPGRRVRLVDTAGQRVSEDEIERIGVDKAQSVGVAADRRLFLVSEDTLKDLAGVTTQRCEGDAVFWTKADLAPAPDAIDLQGLVSVTAAVSTEDASLVDGFARYLEGQPLASAETWSPIAGSARRVAALQTAIETFQDAERLIESGAPELATERIRDGVQALEGLVRPLARDDVLDLVFAQFCIGK